MSIAMPDFSSLSHSLISSLGGFDPFPILRIVSYIVLGVGITLYLRRIVGKVSEKHISAHHSQLLRRLTFYIGLILSFVFPLKASGINVAGLLSAAGIVAGIATAAIAFASQTSISNFLSGVFLIAEKPFEIGDYVMINSTLGEVLSIGLLSVNIRTKDNIFVRIPNESLLKSQFDNLSRFPIRRLDIKLRIAFSEDLQRVKKVLLNTARQNPLCLVTPSPELTFLEFGDSSVTLQFSVWGKQNSFTSLQTNIQMEIQAAFLTNEIKLAPPPSIIAVTS